MLTETIANADLRPCEVRKKKPLAILFSLCIYLSPQVLDSSGVDKNFVQHFLLKHANGVIFLADERTLPEHVIEARMQAIESRKDAAMPFIVAKVRGAPIPANVENDLQMFNHGSGGIEQGAVPQPLPDWDVFEIGSVNALLSAILARANDELRAKLFLKEMLNEKQGKLELNLGRFTQPDRIKHARFQDGLYWVILAHNSLPSIPPALCRDLRNLHSLRLDDNKLTEFPSELALLNLARLKLSENQITSVPHEIKNFTSLVELDLANNLINFLCAL